MSSFSKSVGQRRADDTTVIGLITESDEKHYREEIEGLTAWCQKNNLELNTTKTKELIVDFRKKRLTEPLPLLINGTCVERINTFKFLRVHISNELTFTFNITVSSLCVYYSTSTLQCCHGNILIYSCDRYLHCNVYSFSC